MEFTTFERSLGNGEYETMVSLADAQHEIARVIAEAEAEGYARGLEDAASEIDCGGCKASITGCLDPSNCWHDEANAIRALSAKEPKP